MIAASRATIRQNAVAIIMALGALCLGASGCARPLFDPTGERLFVTEPAGAQRLPLNMTMAEAGNPDVVYGPVAMRPMPGVTRQLVLSPGRRMIMPVGSELVLKAGVLDEDDYLRMNERIEWGLTGVGQFVTVDRGSWVNPLVGDFTSGRKITNNYAVNSTSRRLLRITCGTPDPSDDIQVLRGEAWLTVTSPIEGDSYVTAVAPSIDNWVARQQTAIIHWVDAQIAWPTASIAPAGGSRPLTTCAMRRTDGAPRPCWIVRYELVGGPPAGFAPDGAQIVEIPTDEAGQATATLNALGPTAGVSHVTIQVIRPAEMAPPVQGGVAQRLVVGTSSTTVAWSGPQPTLDAGPITSAPIAPDAPTPAPTTAPALPAPSPPTTPGTPTPLPDFDITTRDRVKVTVLAPEIQIAIGDKVPIYAYVENNSGSPLMGHRVRFAFGTGFRHASGQPEVTLDLPTVPAGMATDQQTTPGIELEAVRAGETFIRTELLNRDGFVVARDETQLRAVTAATAPPAIMPPAVTPPAAAPPTAVAPTLRLTVTSEPATPTTLRTGDSLLVTAEVRNDSMTPAQDVSIVMAADPSLVPKEATRGYRQQIDGSLALTFATIQPGSYDVFRARFEAATTSPTASITISLLQGRDVIDQRTLNFAATTTPMTPGTTPSAPWPGAVMPGEPSEPPRSTLQITAAGGKASIEQGVSETYSFTLSNTGATPQRDVVFEASVSPNLTVSPFGTLGPTAARLDRFPSHTVVRFDPLPLLNPGEQKTYRIQVIGKPVLEGQREVLGGITVSAVSATQADDRLSRVETAITVRRPLGS